VSLNGTDNMVGTARVSKFVSSHAGIPFSSSTSSLISHKTYTAGGATIIETILTYSAPASPGPFNEVHNTALFTIGNVSIYIQFDGTRVTPTCNGAATLMNMTAVYCGNSATAAGSLLHMVHLADLTTVGVILGGKNFTTCAALAGGMNASASATMTGMPAQFTGAAGTVKALGFGVLAAAVGALAFAL